MPLNILPRALQGLREVGAPTCALTEHLIQELLRRARKVIGQRNRS